MHNCSVIKNIFYFICWFTSLLINKNVCIISFIKTSNKTLKQLCFHCFVFIFFFIILVCVRCGCNTVFTHIFYLFFTSKESNRFSQYLICCRCCCILLFSRLMLHLVKMHTGISMKQISLIHIDSGIHPYRLFTFFSIVQINPIIWGKLAR